MRKILDEEDVVECDGVWMVGHVDARVNHNHDDDECPDLECAQGFQLPRNDVRESSSETFRLTNAQCILKNEFEKLYSTMDS